MVNILGSSYIVTLDGKRHLVCKDKVCHVCGTGDCDAVEEVSLYLRNGGPRARNGRAIDLDKRTFHNYWNFPSICPICGGETQYDAGMYRPKQGAGWRCLDGGYTCVYRHRYNHLKEAMQNGQGLEGLSFPNRHGYFPRP